MTTYNNSELNPTSAGASETYFIDAKQRAVTVSREPVGGKSNSVRVCAEPSPDALSAISANQGLSLSKGDKLQVGESLAVAEAAGSIGLRTQSIQLMRDAMYRLCEAYQSGAISEMSYETLSRRFQTSMVAVLAIEQLTGVVRAPAIVLSGKTSSTTAELLADITDKGIKAREAAAKAKTDAEAAATKAKESSAAVKKLKDELAELEKDSNVKTPPAKPTEEQQKRIDRYKAVPAEIVAAEAKEKADKAASESAEKSAKDLATTSASYESARLQLLAGGTAAAVTALSESIPASRPDPASVSAVAAAVSKIALEAMNKSFGNELCTSILTALYSKGAPDQGDFNVVALCQEYLAGSVAFLRDSAEASRAATLFLTSESEREKERKDEEAKKEADHRAALKEAQRKASAKMLEDSKRALAAASKSLQSAKSAEEKKKAEEDMEKARNALKQAEEALRDARIERAIATPEELIRRSRITLQLNPPGE